MKKRIVILFLAFLLCFPCIGCSTEDTSQKKLWVVTDLGWRWSLAGEDELNEERAEVDFQAILNYFGGLPEDLEVELEVLPVNAADLNARLTRIKTEILAGGGPDVFLLTCDDPGGGGWTAQERLFPNPEKAMYAGFFLPLDEYIENAQFMEWDKLTPVVMEAGRTEEGQMIMPFNYNTAGVVVTKKEFLGEKVPKNWDEAVDGENPVYQKGYSWLALNGFPNVFPKVVDNKTEELLITKEELLHRVNQTLLCPNYRSEYPAEITAFVPAGEGQDGYNLWETDLDNTVFLPMRNTEGGYTAYVTYYGAVNRNTDFPQEAFSILDMFLSKQVQKREIFGGTAGDLQRGRQIYLFSNTGYSPVHEELYLGAQNSVDTISASERAFENFDNLRKEITDVYFPSDIEKTIGEMYADCYYSYQEKGNSKDIEKLVSEAYDRIWMMSGES